MAFSVLWVFLVEHGFVSWEVDVSGSLLSFWKAALEGDGVTCCCWTFLPFLLFVGMMIDLSS